MNQIKLDDKRDLAIDGNEVWIIDYSDGIFNPQVGAKHMFHLSPEPIGEIQTMISDPNRAILTYTCMGHKQVKVAHINDKFITFVDPGLDGGTLDLRDDFLRIEQEYHDQLAELREEFSRLEASKNWSADILLEKRTSLERHKEDLDLDRHRKIEALYVRYVQ